jgi:methionyl-tRNA synthetase
MDIRTGTILEAEKMPKANKLLILKVDTGIDVRTIVSGIAESFKPEDITVKSYCLMNHPCPPFYRHIYREPMTPDAVHQRTPKENRLHQPDTDGGSASTGDR